MHNGFSPGPVNVSSRGSFKVNEGLNLYVSQLPASYNSTRLRDVFSRYGPIHSAKVMHDARTNESRCFGFVLFERACDGERAMEAMSGVVLEDGNHRLQIRVARPTALPQPLREDANANATGSGATELSLVKSPEDEGLTSPNIRTGSDDGSAENPHLQQPAYQQNDSYQQNGARRTKRRPQNPYHHPYEQFSSQQDQDMMFQANMGGMMPMATMPFGMYPSGVSPMMASPYMAAMPMMAPTAGYSMMPTQGVYFVPTSFASPSAMQMPMMPQGASAAGGAMPAFYPFTGQWPQGQQQ